MFAWLLERGALSLLQAAWGGGGGGGGGQDQDMHVPPCFRHPVAMSTVPRSYSFWLQCRSLLDIRDCLISTDSKQKILRSFLLRI